MSEKPVALLTAASRGIGEACARELASRGYAVAVLSPSERVLQVAADLDGIGMQGSVLETADLTELAQKAIARWSRIDALVYSTGHAAWSVGADVAFNPEVTGHLLEIPDEDWAQNFEMFFIGLVRIARLVVPHMVHRGGGSIAVISSFASREPRLVFPISSAVRPAVESLVKLMADRYARDGIRVNAVLPGFLENWASNDAVLRSIPLGRLGQLREVARTVAFLLSSDAGYITGQSLLIDGGVNRAF